MKTTIEASLFLRLDTDAALAPFLRHSVVTLLERSWGLTGPTKEFGLMATELYANVVTHAAWATSKVPVFLCRLGGGVVFCVRDGDPRLPCLPTQRDETAESGRGLALLAAYTDEYGGQWGCRPMSAGKITWLWWPFVTAETQAERLVPA